VLESRRAFHWVLGQRQLKDCQLRDSSHLQFSAECFNITNTANFAAPVNNRSSGTFGVITSTAAVVQCLAVLKISRDDARLANYGGLQAHRTPARRENGDETLRRLGRHGATGIRAILELADIPSLLLARTR
jgi:hypothetical protein